MFFLGGFIFISRVSAYVSELFLRNKRLISSQLLLVGTTAACEYSQGKTLRSYKRITGFCNRSTLYSLSTPCGMSYV